MSFLMLIHQKKIIKTAYFRCSCRPGLRRHNHRARGGAKSTEERDKSEVRHRDDHQIPRKEADQGLVRFDGRRAGGHTSRGKVGENGGCGEKGRNIFGCGDQVLNLLSFFVCKYELAIYNGVDSCFKLLVF